MGSILQNRNLLRRLWFIYAMNQTRRMDRSSNRLRAGLPRFVLVYFCETYILISIIESILARHNHTVALCARQRIGATDILVADRHTRICAECLGRSDRYVEG